MSPSVSRNSEADLIIGPWFILGSVLPLVLPGDSESLRSLYGLSLPRVFDLPTVLSKLADGSEYPELARTYFSMLYMIFPFQTLHFILKARAILPGLENVAVGIKFVLGGVGLLTIIGAVSWKLSLSGTFATSDGSVVGLMLHNRVALGVVTASIACAVSMVFAAAVLVTRNWACSSQGGEA